MHLIPVIDVRLGRAVHAVMGDRAGYRPIETPLAEGSDPLSLAVGYRSLHPFHTIYVADLDGIEGRGRNLALLDRLVAALPGIELWVDDGSISPAATRPLLARLACVPVIGSESLANVDDLTALHAGGAARILSLDFRGAAFAGPAALLERRELWPDRVIVMTLGRVGSGAGPDLDRLGAIVRAAPGRQVYAAGGVRHAGDLAAIRRAGAAGALVATALHAGTLTSADLDHLKGASP
jgi:HisA/HisF family protein